MGSVMSPDIKTSMSHDVWMTLDKGWLAPQAACAHISQMHQLPCTQELILISTIMGKAALCWCTNSAWWATLFRHHACCGRRRVACHSLRVSKQCTHYTTAGTIFASPRDLCILGNQHAICLRSLFVVQPDRTQAEQPHLPEHQSVS